MKIACATWSYDEHQGISRCVVELTARLAAEHEVHVYAAEVHAQARPGVHLHPVPLRFPRAHVNDWDFFFRAGRRLRQQSFDLLHVHFPVWCPADVYTCHGIARMALRALRRFPPEAKLDVPTRRMLPWYVQIPLYTYVARNPRTLIAAVSRKAQLEAAEESGRRAEDIAVVPNAVDLQRFRPEAGARWRRDMRQRLGLADGQFVLLWVGNHLRHKGIRHALRTLEQLPPEAVLLAVGGDSPDSVPDLAASITRLQSAGRLKFCGVALDIEKYYAAADALLFPSLYESFGLVVLEAMAMGLPVVTARTVGFAEEAIRDGSNGFVVDQCWDSEAMAMRIRRLMSEAGLAARVGEAAYLTAKRYGWDQYVLATERVYERALAARSLRNGRGHAA